MTLKPIRSGDDYDAALKLLETLWDAEPGSPEAEKHMGSSVQTL
ncbi:hypothetical protein [Thalassospira xiamenensis]|nr:hypothetical protein [Thalassospira xiamenensis]